MIRRLGNVLAGSLACLAILALAAPGLAGFYLAREHQRLVSQLSVPGVARFEIIAFDRGWFNSRLRLRAIPSRCPAAGCRGIVLDNVIHHGPVPFTAPENGGEALAPARAVVETRVSLAPLFGELRVQPAAPAVTVNTRLPLKGGAAAIAELPETELRVAGGDGAARLTAAPLTVRASAPAGGALRIDVDWPRFSLVAERGGQIAFRGLNAGFTGEDGNWRDYQIALENAQFATAGGRGAAFQGLRLDATAGDGGAGDFALRLSRLAARGNEYGPALLDGRLRNQTSGGMLPLPAIIAAGANADPPRSALLRVRPTLQLNRILLGTPNGDVRGELDLRVREAAGEAALVTALAGKAALLVPAPMMENVTAAVMRHRHPEQPPPTPRRVEAAIDEWRAHGFIGYREADDAYTIDAVLEGRDLLVNGRKLTDWPSLLERIEPEAAGDASASSLGPHGRSQ